MQSTHPHPNPRLNRINQYGMAALLIIMLVAVVAQFALVILDPRNILMLFSGIVTLLLTLPVLMQTTMTPALTVEPDGLTITPVVWKPLRVAWSEVQAVKHYPLLPDAGAEVGRKALVGSKNYRPAEGKMLVIPSLPVQYRVNGFFCGEGLTPVIAFTNRSHRDYDKLLKKVMIYCEETGA